jgi:hypothetical protein
VGTYRVFTGTDGESHIEELDLASRPDLSSLTNVTEVRVAHHEASWVNRRAHGGAPYLKG